MAASAIEAASATGQNTSNAVGEYSGGASGIQGIDNLFAQAGFNAAQSGLQFGLNAAAASKSWDRQKNYLTRKYIYEMKALRDAGLNPILAAGAGIGKGGPGSAPQASGVSQGQLSALVAKQARLLDAQARAATSAAGQSDAMAGLHRVNTQLQALGVPRKLVEANYYSGPKGYETFKRATENAALPNNWQTLLVKEGFNFLRDHWPSTEEMKDTAGRALSVPSFLVPKETPSAKAAAESHAGDEWDVFAPYWKSKRRRGGASGRW